jgi:hypothetical protein
MRAVVFNILREHLAAIQVLFQKILADSEMRFRRQKSREAHIFQEKTGFYKALTLLGERMPGAM